MIKWIKLTLATIVGFTIAYLFCAAEPVHAASIVQTPSSESGMMYHTHQGSVGFEQYMIIRKDGKAVFCVDPWKVFFIKNRKKMGYFYINTV